jgi:SWI/SNF-related matrix-associated actin-dependent regulator 1 of chromatin subfamily A
MLNRPKELISQLKAIGKLGAFGGFWTFAKRYCGAYQGVGGWDMNSARNLDELNKKLRGSCMIRRLKVDVLEELPDKQSTDIVVDISNVKDYIKAETDLVRYLQDQVLEDEEFLGSIEHLNPEEQEQMVLDVQEEKKQAVDGAEHLVKIEALKQLCAEGKLKSFYRWAKDFLETGEKLVVFAHHRKIVEKISAEFNCPKIMGGMPIKDRQFAIDEFQNDPNCKILVGNIKAMGVGITLTAASNVAFLELAWTPADHMQAEDRCHRIGQKDSVNVYYFIGRDTIDGEIYQLLDKKRSIIKRAIDGDESAEVGGSVFGDLVKLLRRRTA